MKTRQSPAINLESLRTAYFGVRSVAPSVDGETWQRYGDALEQNLYGLYARIKRGARHSKGAGQRDPTGVPQLERQIIQRAEIEMRNALY